MNLLYGPKLPITGVSFLLLGVSSFYGITTLTLLILTLSIILFRFIRLLTKEGTLKRLVPIILLILSIIFIYIFLITSLGKIDANNKIKQSEKILNLYENKLDIAQENNIVIPVQSLTIQNNSIGVSKINNLSKNPISGEILGFIYIEKISLKLPIIEDATDENLWLGANHIQGTSLPWEKGNSFLASHDVRIYGKLFNRLNELNIGDKITLSMSNGNFTYVVYDKSIVFPNDTKCFEKIKGEYNLSLVTCTKVGGKRVIVYCERMSK